MKTIEQRQIQQMAAPVLLNYLLLTIFETLDKSIVGHYSVQGFAVIGIAEHGIVDDVCPLRSAIHQHTFISGFKIPQEQLPPFPVALERDKAVAAIVIPADVAGLAPAGGRRDYRDPGL